ncbi:Multidrug resistance-associated protein 5 [Cladochytrium tenue]|nr:Multidrug resistance-associated protein 5 [Cladochytrium tenue]
MLMTSLFAAIGRSTVSPSLIGLALSYVLQVTQLLNQSIRQYTDAEVQLVSVERLHHYATRLPAEAPAIVQNRRPPPEWPHEGRVVLKNVSMRYAEDLPLVLRDVSISIEPGEKPPTMPPPPSLADSENIFDQVRVRRMQSSTTTTVAAPLSGRPSKSPSRQAAAEGTYNASTYPPRHNRWSFTPVSAGQPVYASSDPRLADAMLQLDESHAPRLLPPVSKRNQVVLAQLISGAFPSVSPGCDADALGFNNADLDSEAAAAYNQHYRPRRSRSYERLPGTTPNAQLAARRQSPAGSRPLKSILKHASSTQALRSQVALAGIAEMSPELTWSEFLKTEPTPSRAGVTKSASSVSFSPNQASNQPPVGKLLVQARRPSNASATSPLLTGGSFGSANPPYGDTYFELQGNMPAVSSSNQERANVGIVSPSRPSEYSPRPISPAADPRIPIWDSIPQEALPAVANGRSNLEGGNGRAPHFFPFRSRSSSIPRDESGATVVFPIAMDAPVHARPYSNERLSALDGPLMLESTATITSFERRHLPRKEFSGESHPSANNPGTVGIGVIVPGTLPPPALMFGRKLRQGMAAPGVLAGTAPQMTY